VGNREQNPVKRKQEIGNRKEGRGKGVKLKVEG
jgi:hypothetical protein